eukprot:s2271_g5.t1
MERKAKIGRATEERSSDKEEVRREKIRREKVRRVGKGEMKNCTLLWREAHFEVKSVKDRRSRSTFGKLQLAASPDSAAR